MRRFWIGTFLIGSAVLLGCALLVPAHFRAVDAAVIESVGRGKPGAPAPTLVEEVLALLSTEKLGPARMLWRAAQAESVPQNEQLGVVIARYARENPTLVALGGAAPILDKVDLGQAVAAAAPVPIVDLLTRRAAREAALKLLQGTRRPGVQQMLFNRNLTNTVHFPSAATSAGQALEAAILTAALLNQGDYFSPAFRDAIDWLALRANKGDDSSSLELVYLDLLSLGRRLDWVSLAELMRQIEDFATLRELAEAMRVNEESAVNIYSAALLSGRPASVAKYLARFPETGLNDLNFALRCGPRAVELLIRQQQRVYYAGVRNQVTGYDPFGAVFFGLVPAAVATRTGALVLKYAILLFGAFCLARSIGMITSALGIKFGFRLAADVVFALAMAFVVGVAIEPFVGLPEQQNELPVLFQFPNLAGATGSKLQQITQPYMNHLTLTSLILFFVIQATIYVFCLAKLAEIRRQPLGPRMKLRLLENEDLLFDAGLYVGFVGSVLALILMSIGVGKVSMMAYASTSFGIIFVSVLKIFHVRPLRRQLIMESETQFQA
ncbi:MAG: hypothetical protein KIS67_10445 [Verrucomicrobiae bacterium]|nr:hypothetical protein [Verrucomicrobiae bacterium]